MDKQQNKVWNGKNLANTDKMEFADMIGEKKRTSKTASKYDVSVDTISADDLQPDPSKK